MKLEWVKQKEREREERATAGFKSAEMAVRSVKGITEDEVNIIMAHIRKMKGEQVETDGMIRNNAVNLCDSCRGEYPACPAKECDVRFGDGKGRDNICACAFYLPAGLKGE